MQQTEPFAVAVLAGGSSRRMGRDKALIEIDGDAMVLRVVDEAQKSGAAETFVVGRDAGQWPNVRSVPDRFPGDGPLGGLITALGHSTAEVLVLMPCDLVHPASASVRSVVTALSNAPDAAVVVPVVRSRRQYVQAGFRRSALVQMEAEFASGARSIHGGIAGLTVVELVMDEADWFADADVPSDLPVAFQQEDFGE